MTVFYYDKSFEGLLTSLFEAYNRHVFPDCLIAEGLPAPMFGEEIFHVLSDAEKAARVWRGLQRKLPDYICRMMMYVWLSEEERSDMLLFRYMRKVFDSPRQVITDFADDDILHVKQLGQKVSNDGRCLCQFIRFQKASDGTFFAPVSPVYNSLPIAVEYLTDRFGDQKWFVYDTKRGYGYIYDLRKVTEVTMPDDASFTDGILPAEIAAPEERQFQELWRNYHKAITIQERINPKLQRRNMPRRYWKYITEMR